MPVYNEDGVEVVTSAAAGGITVKEVDGSPSVTATTIRFPNGTLTDDGGGQVTVATQDLSFAIIADHKAKNTAGGTFTSGAWRTRDLNTEVSDADAIVTISSNQFKPIAGDYTIVARAPARSTDWHQAKLQNATAGTTTLTGSSCYNPASGAIQNDSWVIGAFTANGSDYYEIQHYAITTGTTIGFGGGSNITTEVYTSVLLVKTA